MTDEHTDDCCRTAPPSAGPSLEDCPACGARGRGVSALTVGSLVKEAAQARLSSLEGFRFCATTGCEVAYFHGPTGERLSVGQLRVRVGQKESAASRPACYCFDHTAGEIQAQVAESGRSSIPEEVSEKCRQGLHRCEETNPQGSCCLGDLHRIAKEAGANRESSTASPAAADQVRPPEGPRRETGMWAAGRPGTLLLSVDEAFEVGRRTNADRFGEVAS